MTTNHAWNDALSRAKTLEPGQAAKANDLLMVRTKDGVTAWGYCPMSGLQLLDPHPQPVITTPALRKFVTEMQDQGLSRLDYANRSLVRQWRIHLDGGSLTEALYLAKEGM